MLRKNIRRLRKNLLGFASQNRPAVERQAEWPRRAEIHQFFIVHIFPLFWDCAHASITSGAAYESTDIRPESNWALPRFFQGLCGPDVVPDGFDAGQMKAVLLALLFDNLTAQRLHQLKAPCEDALFPESAPQAVKKLGQQEAGFGLGARAMDAQSQNHSVRKHSPGVFPALDLPFQPADNYKWIGVGVLTSGSPCRKRGSPAIFRKDRERDSL